MPALTTSTPTPPAANADTVMILVADFDAIFLRFHEPLTRFIAHALGDREQAFDLAQDVFVKVYESLLGGTAIPQKALASWLYRIAANTISDSLRRQRLITWLPLSLFNEESQPGSGALALSMGATMPGLRGSIAGGERPGWMKAGHALWRQSSFDGGELEERVAERQIIERVFQQLSPRYSICLWLYEHEGLSCPEIAQALRISVTATKMRLSRARERFLALYQQETGEFRIQPGA